MKKSKIKSQASSSRAVSIGFRGFSSIASSSSLSYLTEPPDLSTISNPHLILALKTLSKKDETTRTKALQELRTHINLQAKEKMIEDPVIEAWIKVYPRLAIDTSRLARDLSHSLQYDLLSSFQKRMSIHVSKFIGPWLSGQFDRDRMVSSNVKNAINSFLQTEKKRVAFYTRYQDSILKYAHSAFQETPETLSDERLISKEEMWSKYFTVLGSSISLVVELFRTLDNAEIIKLEESYDEFLSDEKLWQLVTCEESHIRRIVCDLLILCCRKQRELVSRNLKTLANDFVYKGLRAPHVGTASRFLDALRALTISFPQIWSSIYVENSRKASKRNPLKEISSFILTRPRLEPDHIWESLQKLLQVLPSEILPQKSEDAAEFLRTLENSILQKNEMRSSKNKAWCCYLSTAEFLINRQVDKEAKLNLIKGSLFPLFKRFLNTISISDQPQGNSSQREVAVLNSNTALQAYLICSRQAAKDLIFHEEWEQLGAELIHKIQTSLPEQSGDFRLSQDAVIRLGKLWFSLLSEVLKSQEYKDQLQIDDDPLLSQSKLIIQMALTTLIARDGKPYCTAGILEAAISLAPDLFTTDPKFLSIVRDTVMVYLPKLIQSHSASFLIRIIFHLPSLHGLEEYFNSSWSIAIDSYLCIVHSLPTEKKMLVVELISNEAAAPLAQENQGLQGFFLKEIESYAHGDYSNKSILSIAFQSSAISEISAISARDLVVEYLNVGVDLDGTFFILNLLNSYFHHLLGTSSNVHVNILIKLLEIREKALLQEVDSGFAEQSEILMAEIMGETPTNSILQLISIDLEERGEGPHFVSVGYLIKEAKKITGNADDPNLLNSLLPNTLSWRKFLFNSPEKFPGDMVAVNSDLSSVAYLINSNSSSGKSFSPSFDIHGFSMPLRKAIYTAGLLPLLYKALAPAILTDILEMLTLTYEITYSDANFLECNLLYSSDLSVNAVNLLNNFLQKTPGMLKELASEAYYWPQEVAQTTMDSFPDENLEKAKRNEPGNLSTVMQDLLTRLINVCQLLQPMSFYAAQALSRLLEFLLEKSDLDIERVDDWLFSLGLSKLFTENIIGASAILVGLGKYGKSSKIAQKICNQLASNIPSLNINSDDIFSQLTLFGSCLSLYDDMELPIAQNRLVFAVKHIMSWTQNYRDIRLISEICKILQKILPAIKNIYGSFWEESLSLCVSIWTKQKDMPPHKENIACMSASLNLYSRLKEINNPNDDLNETLDDFQKQISSNLLDLLFIERSKQYNHLHQVADQALASLVFSLPAQEIEDVVRFYPLLVSEYRWVQAAAFILIHRRLPTLQQQLSVEVALENKAANFSDELLSLIVSSPRQFDFSLIQEKPYITSPEFTTSVRSYLLAWLLVFEKFSASSYKVRNDYNDILKSQKCVGPLMDFIFQALGHMDDRPVDLKRKNICTSKIREYNLLSSLNDNDPEEDIICMLVNIYFQSLKYAPSIVKSWWLDTKKQLKHCVCSWTEKYISPILVDDELDMVINWAENQGSPDDEGKNLIVKVARKVSEVSVGYEIDDMVMQILIRVPDSYPLDLVKIESVNRVGITAQRWNSFLMTTHGVINFSNGSISDALLVFRKNVIGALKGHVECAICYSIISADRKVPDKRCGTCHNLFHSNCLFQWFKSSNQSTCPLCRNPFNY